MTRMDVLRDLYNGAAEAAPDGAGLLAAVQNGVVRRRRRRASLVAATVALLITAAGVTLGRHPHDRTAPATVVPTPSVTRPFGLSAAPAMSFPCWAESWPAGTWDQGVALPGTTANLYGTDGRRLDYRVSHPGPGEPHAALILVSGRAPAVPGTAVHRSVHGFPATVHTDVALNWGDLYTGTGSTTTWQPEPGMWITLVLYRGTTVDQAVTWAGGVTVGPHPIHPPIEPTLLPDGMSLVMSDPTVARIEPYHRTRPWQGITILKVADATPLGRTQTTYGTAVTIQSPVGRVRVAVDVPITFDLDAFVAGIRFNTA